MTINYYTEDNHVFIYTDQGCGLVSGLSFESHLLIQMSLPLVQDCRLSGGTDQELCERGEPVMA